jgi:hypothetical protein
MTDQPLSAAEQARLDTIEAAPAAPESWFPYIASEGDFGPGQVSHRVRNVTGSDYRYETGCGTEFGGPGDLHPDWNTWSVSGPFDGDEWPEITCPRCPQPIRPHADAQAALARVTALADALATRYPEAGPHTQRLLAAIATDIRDTITDALKGDR